MLLRAKLPTSFAALLMALFGNSVLAGAVMASTDGPGQASGEIAVWAGRALAYALQLAGVFGDWLADGIERNPVIMIGLAGLLVLPVVAVLGRLVLGRYQDDNPEAGVRNAIELPRSAWVRFEGDEHRRMAIEREIVQIGRDADNDICLGDNSVQRYHAVIERLPDTGYCIVDLSGPNGHGVRVNGRRMAKAWLASGDVVQIGRSRLRFETAA